MRRAATWLALGILGVLPTTAGAGGIDLRVGGFFPQAGSNLFDDVADLYLTGGDTIRKADWVGVTGGVEFSAKLVDNLEIGFHVDGFSRTLHTSYRDYVHESGREIVQSLELDVVPVGVSLRLVPTRRSARLAPYVSAGVDLFFWQYEEWGEFVDSETGDIWDDLFMSEGVAPGFHVAAGLRVGLTDDLSLVGEGRYQEARDDMGDDFRGYRVSLSGASATVGLHVRF